MVINLTWFLVACDLFLKVMRITVVVGVAVKNLNRMLYFVPASDILSHATCCVLNCCVVHTASSKNISHARGGEIEYYKTCLQAFQPIITNTVTSKMQLPFVETGLKKKKGLQYRDNRDKETWVKQAENTENLTDGGFVKQGALDC